MTDVLALLLAGGRVDELLCLTERRAKAALPIFGTYRIIDFVLSNCMHAGIPHVGILSQYRPHALVRHIGTGEHWDFIGRQRSIRILPPYLGKKGSDWYKGTADAVFQNIPYIEEFSPKHVLIASADHVYRMDYKPLIKFHIDHDADATVCFTRIKRKHSRFGYGVINKNQQLTAYEEKPSTPPSDWVSMTLYLFKTELLIDVLASNARESSHEFGKDIVPELVSNHAVFAYAFEDYWAYARTLKSYYRTNMDLLDNKFNLINWQIRTNLLERCAQKDRLPAHIDGVVSNSVISDECVIKGRVINSILSPGVKVERGAEVTGSIIYHDTEIRQNARLTDVVCDKDSIIKEGAVIGGFGSDIPSKEHGSLLDSGITVLGRTSTIPQNTRIGANTIINPSSRLTEKDIPAGSTVR